MKLKTNINAFTLLESLITLMLISIIIGLTYALINLVEKQLIVLEQEHTEILEYNLFNSALINDINTATSYDFEEEDKLLKLHFYDNSLISYEIKPNEILRQTSFSSDAFNIKTINHNLSNTYKHTALELQLILLKDTLSTHYTLKKDEAQSINKKLFNED